MNTGKIREVCQSGKVGTMNYHLGVNFYNLNCSLYVELGISRSMVNM